MATRYKELGLGRVRASLPITDEQAAMLSRMTEVAVYNMRGVSKRMIRRINCELRDRGLSFVCRPWSTVTTHLDRFQSLDDQAAAIYAKYA